MSEKQFFVGFADVKLKATFEKLKSGKFEDKELYGYINRAVDDLKKDPTCGIAIPKNLIPKIYRKKFAVDNLWKYDLPNAWRLIYTIKGDRLMIVAVLLEWMDHKGYEKRFGYG